MANNKNYKKKGNQKGRPSQNTSKKPSGAKKQTASRSSNQNVRSSNSSVKKKVYTEVESKPKMQGNIYTVLFFISSLFFFFFTIVEGENLWFDIHTFVLGIFGIFAILWAFFFIYASVKSAYKTEGQSNRKLFIYIIIGLVLLSTFWYVFFSSSIYHDGAEKSSYFKIISASYKDGSHGSGASVLSALLGGLLCIAFGVTGAKISVLLLIFLFIIVLSGYRIDFIDKAWQAVLKRLKFIFEVIVVFFGEIKKERLNKPKKEKNPINLKKLFEKKKPQPQPVKANINLSKEKRNYSFEQFEKMTESEYAPSEKEPSYFSDKGVYADDDIDITDIMSKSLPYNYDESKKNIMDFLGADALNEEDGSFDDYDDEDLDLNEIFCIRDGKKNKTEKKNEVDNSSKDEPYTENSSETDDPFNVMEPEAKDEEEEEIECYKFPPISLLSKPSNEEGLGITSELRANGELLVQTLKSFGVSTRILNISRGPAITRYELQPSAGVKISRITSLSDDIALNLSASAVRIEAPIPGKPAVGIEIPNKEVSVVKLREIIDTNDFNTARSKLTVALGKDINGDCALADLAKMPHLLIAGTTGSGKSVCINSIIISLLYKASPDEVKLLLVDPKVVELGVYNGIPHLLVPVVTDAKKAAGALAWAVTEMMKRYNTFADNNVRDIFGYNSFAEKNGMRKMEQIVIVIDELADLMMVAAKEVEDSIHRLAQMARAAGMYLIIATQRPSVDTITGVIKANIPSRIAFAVSSPVDSRTIIDSSGAEKLIGRGDMLFVPIGATKPKRIQGCFISDNEIEQVVEFIKNSQTAEYDADISSEIDRQAELTGKSKKSSAPDDDGGGFDFEDEALMQAIEFVIDAGQASTSMLQRRLRVGYARAGRLIDEMENMGIVGPHEGSKPRNVLMTKDQFLEMKMRKSGGE